jgi:hypothetical protein
MDETKKITTVFSKFLCVYSISKLLYTALSITFSRGLPKLNSSTIINGVAVDEYG